MILALWQEGRPEGENDIVSRRQLARTDWGFRRIDDRRQTLVLKILFENGWLLSRRSARAWRRCCALCSQRYRSQREESDMDENKVTEARTALDVRNQQPLDLRAA